MTVVIHHCGWASPHNGHVSAVTHRSIPSMVTMLSCPGTDPPPMESDLWQEGYEAGLDSMRDRD